MSKPTSRIAAGLLWLFALCAVPGGALWMASPLGIFLANGNLTQGSDMFWMLFPSAPLLLGAGVIGLWAVGALGGGWLTRLSAVAALAGQCGFERPAGVLQGAAFPELPTPPTLPALLKWSSWSRWSR